MTAGYSTSPLARKLGIKEGDRVWLIDQPAYYLSLFADLPEVEQVENQFSEVNFIHLFCSQQQQLIIIFPTAKEALAKDGIFWISWPKKSSSIPSDLSRDWIRDFVLKRGLVDVKICAVDMDWSGLKFVYRLQDR